jgi:outer membrane lipoprotein-sorting protein
MKKILLPFIFISFTMASFAQTADEVIAKHTEAMGGKEKLAALKSVYMETVSVMNGNEATAKLWKVNNQLMRREFNFGMGTVTMLMTDKEGWSSNPRSGGKFEALPADIVLSQQSELDCAGPLVDYTAKGHKAELIGKEDVNGVSAHVVKLTLKSGRDITYFLDANTYYILRTKTKGGGMRRGAGANPDAETIVEYSDYRKTEEGYVFPYATTIVGMGAATNVEKIEVNKPVDPKLIKPE